MIVTTKNKIACPDRFIVRNTADLLNRLNRPDSDIVIMPQELSRDTTSGIKSVASDAPVHEQRLTITRELAGAQVADALQETGILSTVLPKEMIRTVDFFAELFGQSQMELRWEVTDQQSCPKFHCDNVYVRMLTTYFGPTTEFIDQGEPGIIYRAPLHALVFLKGHKHPTYQDRILHRSPEFSSGDKRICMIVNFCDWLPKR